LRYSVAITQRQTVSRALLSATFSALPSIARASLHYATITRAISSRPRNDDNNNATFSRGSDFPARLICLAAAIRGVAAMRSEIMTDGIFLDFSRAPAIIGGPTAVCCPCFQDI